MNTQYSAITRVLPIFLFGLFMNFLSAQGNDCSTTTVITNDDFESGFGNWNDGGEDCSKYTYNYECLDNSQKIRLKDNSGEDSSLFSDTYDLTTYDEITVEFEYLVQSFESNEDWYIEFSSDNGSNWTTIAQYVVDNDFTEDVCYNESVTILASSQTFNTQNKIRFRCDAGQNNDKLYLDDITVSGITNSVASFTTDNNTIEVNNTVNFTNTSSNVTSYSWNFGDGSPTSTETSPSHQYTATGTYTVTLTATSSCGSDTTATTTIAVNNPIETLFFENFEDENQGDTSGTDAYGTTWSTDTSGTNADRFEVRNDNGNNIFEGDDIDGTAEWQTQTINISNYDDLKLSSFIEFDGDFESDEDFINFYYKLDGGSITNVPNAQYAGDNNNGTFTWSLTGISGNTLEIIIAMNNDSNSEEYKIDNVTLTGMSDCSPITAYTVTGDDLAYCSGNTQTTTIGLSDSDVGVDYQLLKDGAPTPLRLLTARVVHKP